MVNINISKVLEGEQKSYFRKKEKKRKSKKTTVRIGRGVYQI